MSVCKPKISTLPLTAACLACLALVPAMPASGQEAPYPPDPYAGTAQEQEASATGGMTADGQPRRRQSADASGGRGMGIAPLPPLEPISPLPTIRGANVSETTLETSTRGTEYGELLQKPRDPFAPPGLRTGAFTWHAVLESDGVFTDNLYQTKNNRKAAIGARSAPALRVRSNWLRHELDATLKGEFIAWDNAEKEATVEAGVKLRLDVRRTTTARLEANYVIGEEDDAIGRLQHDLKLKAELTHDMGRLRLRAGVEAARRMFTAPLSGGGSGYDDDYDQPAASLRLSYSASPAAGLYVETGGDLRIYDKNRDAAGVRRNSKSAYVEAGLELSPSAIWSGSLGLRAALRDYREPGVKSVRGIGVNGELTWKPSRATEVKLKSTFAIDETTSAGASGVRKYTLELAPRHMLRRNLTLKGILGLEYSDYAGSPLEELVLRSGVEVAWVFHRGYELVGAYGLEHQWSNASAAGYLENRITIGLRYRL